MQQFSMGENEGLHPPGADKLSQDLGTEYYNIMRVVDEFDGRLMTVKNWSVTLSLAGLGLGFQSGHYALFGLASLTALAFWFMEAGIKRHQIQYYARMRDIEVAAYHLNHVRVHGQTVSAPKIDWYWGFTGKTEDHRSAEPTRRTPENVRRMLRRAPWMRHVLLPHVVAVILGLALFAGALMGVPGVGDLPL